MTVKEIVEAYLRANGFDGLYADECSCTVDDLEPCGYMMSECLAGYIRPCDCGNHDWHIGPEKGVA